MQYTNTFNEPAILYCCCRIKILHQQVLTLVLKVVFLFNLAFGSIEASVESLYFSGIISYTCRPPLWSFRKEKTRFIALDKMMTSLEDSFSLSLTQSMSFCLENMYFSLPRPTCALEAVKETWLLTLLWPQKKF